MADPTPEERAERIWRSLDGLIGAECIEAITAAIRSAETAARTKAFEEALEICNDRSALVRVNGRPHASRDIEIVADEISALAKGAPRG